MGDLPCRVSIDLRAYQRQQDENEREWAAGIGERKWQAEMDCMDRKALEKVLDDEQLAGPLAHLMQDLEMGADLTKSAKSIRAVLIEFLTGEE